jgi:hypothetical protein
MTPLAPTTGFGFHNGNTASHKETRQTAVFFMAEMTQLMRSRLGDFIHVDVVINRLPYLHHAPPRFLRIALSHLDQHGRAPQGIGQIARIGLAVHAQQTGKTLRDAITANARHRHRFQGKAATWMWRGESMSGFFAQVRV